MWQNVNNWSIFCEVFLGVLYILFATFIYVQNYFIIKSETIKCGDRAFPLPFSPLHPSPSLHHYAHCNSMNYNK